MILFSLHFLLQYFRMFCIFFPTVQSELNYSFIFSGGRLGLWLWRALRATWSNWPWLSPFAPISSAVYFAKWLQVPIFKNLFRPVWRFEPRPANHQVSEPKNCIEQYPSFHLLDQTVPSRFESSWRNQWSSLHYEPFKGIAVELLKWVF